MGFYVSSNHIDATLLSLMSRLKHGIGLSDTCGITEKDFEFSAFLSGIHRYGSHEEADPDLVLAVPFYPSDLSLK